MTTTPTLPRRAINAYAARRQGLDRSRSWSQVTAAGAPLCHYATGATLYPSLAARHEPAPFAEIADSLDRRRDLVRMRAMRGTLFAVPKHCVAVAYQATRRQNQAFFRNTLKYYEIAPEEYEAVRQRILATLDSVDLSIAQLKKALAPLAPQVERGFGAVRSAMGAEGAIVRARGPKGWRGDSCTYARFDQWTPDVDLASISAEDAAIELAVAYFDACGPATLDDFQWWSGLTRAEAAPALESARPRLRPIQFETLAGVHWLPADAEITTSDAAAGQVEASIRLLPLWDAYIMAYRARERYLEPTWADRVYDAVGNSTSALLVDGEVGGVWDWDDGGKRHVFKVAPFEKISEAHWAQVVTEANRLVKTAHGAKATSVEVRACPPPQSLLRGGQNLFKSPLQDVEGTPVQAQ